MRVSLVIPAYNVESWIANAIESVLQQDEAPDEVIVVDDGSTDETGKIAAGYRGVQVIRRRNGGLASARNAGAARANADAVFFLDADDELLPGAMERLRGVAAAREDCSVIIPNCIRHAAGGSRLAWATTPPVRTLGRADVRGLMKRNWLSPHALIRKDVWEAFRYCEDLRAAEDLELWLRMLLEGERIALVGDPCVSVRQSRPGSLSSMVANMRRSRRAVFMSLWRRRDLALPERAVVAYQLARTTAGIFLAPRAARSSGPLASLQVYLDDGGGGPTHVSLLEQGLDQRIRSASCGLDPRNVRRPGLSWARDAFRILGAADRRTIVHAHGLRAAAVAMPAVLIRGARFVITVHGLHAIRRRHGRTTRTPYRLLLACADRVLVLSESDRTTLVALGLVRPARITAVRAAFRTPRRVDRRPARRELSISESDLVVVWVGRLSREKDPITFVRAIRQVAADSPVLGLVAGDGPLRAWVEHIARGGPVRVLGRVGDPSVVLAAADLFVSTSLWEGLPMAVLEAAAAGLPLVLTDVPGNRDIAGVTSAVLVPPGNPQAIAEAIRQLCRRPTDRVRATTEKIVRREFGPDLLATDVLSVYREIA
jgi:glycosyltransferase involved in cell wall biosynthesis